MWGAIAGAVVSGLVGMSSANKAAKAQKQASQGQLQLGREQLELQREQMGQNREIYDQQIERAQPFYGAGTNALAAYQSELGLGAAPEGYQGISMSPGAQFALTQGRDQIEGGAAARGGLNSGATLQALERLRMGMAAQDRDSQLNRLAGMTDMGMGAATLQANAGNSMANNNANTINSMGQTTQFMGNALANQGNAAAAGAVGVGNALQGAIQNGMGAWGYMNQMNQGGGGNALFGGNSWG